MGGLRQPKTPGGPGRPWEGSVGQAPLGVEAPLVSDHSPVVMHRGSLEGSGSLTHGPCELGYNSSDSGRDPTPGTPPPGAQGV